MHACMCREISRLLKVNVMGYDYTGYGCSAGDAPSVGHTLSDVTAVYEYMVKVGGVPTAWIVLRRCTNTWSKCVWGRLD